MIAALALAASMYTVKAGDTLWGLVGNDWPAVCEENHLADCNLIYPGEELNLAVHENVVLISSVHHDAPAQPSQPRYEAGGTLGCTGLENLWESAGGSYSAAFMAAEIAMAESGGNQYALSPTNDYGYWQINGSHGSLATFNAYGNARAAILISNDGTNWSPWTTYETGAYIGRCLFDTSVGYCRNCRCTGSGYRVAESA